MTKALLCISCSDIVSPFNSSDTSHIWRWCQCNKSAVRWRDPYAGLLEVTSMNGPDFLRVIGINNWFLEQACEGFRTPEQWRVLHKLSTELVDKYYLFHHENRACWALMIRPGETGDVFAIKYEEAYIQTKGQSLT